MNEVEKLVQAVEEGSRITDSKLATLESRIREVEEAVLEPLRNAPRPGGGEPLLGGAGESWGSIISQRLAAGPLSPSGSIEVPAPIRQIAYTDEQPRRILAAIPRSDEFLTGSFYCFLQETTRDHQAAPVEQGEAKPISDYQLTLEQRSYATIAHISPGIHRDLLSDAPRLREYIDATMLRGVELATENEIVNGDGTGGGLKGLLDEAGDTQTWETDALVTTRKALSLLQSAEIPNGVYVLSPEDWESLELTIAASESGVFYWGGPVQSGPLRLWGQPVIVTPSLSEGTGLLVDFKGSTCLWERQAAELSWTEGFFDASDGNGGSSDFQKNLLRFRAEARVGFAVTRPSGVIAITLTGNGG